MCFIIDSLITVYSLQDLLQAYPGLKSFWWMMYKPVLRDVGDVNE
jgi:hypothetical protein